MFSEIQFKDWKVPDIQSNAKGAKSASVLSNGENPRIRIATAGEPLTTPFHPSAFNDGAARLNIDFYVPKYLEDFIVRLDDWAKKHYWNTRLDYSNDKFPHLRSILCTNHV